MRKSSIFFNTICTLDDVLYKFVNLFDFVPHAFGHHKDTPLAFCSQRVIGDFELIYTVGGKGFVEIGDDCYESNAGDIILVPPFTKNKIQTSNIDLHNNYWFHFDVFPYYRQGMFMKAMLPHGENIIHIGMGNELIEINERLEAECASKKPGFHIFMNTALLQIITIILRFNKVDTSVEQDTFRTDSNWIIDKSIEFVNNNIMGNIKIKDLCEYVHISESCLFKNFIKYLKMSPNEYIQRIRMKQAEQMMMTTKLTIREISDYLGFSSPSYFSYTFKKYYSITPNEFMNL